MAKLGFVYDITRCTGCKACQVACKDKNNLPEGDYYRRVDIFEYEGHTVRYSGACNHCEEPLCAAACLTGAMHKAADGTVQHADGLCIGCGACVWSCPYGAPHFSRGKGLSQKCDACADLREKGQSPACVQACITHCLRFEALEDAAPGETPGFLPAPELTRPALRILPAKRSKP